jgi:predicted metal-dependent HD superfamily phosphohydrolase
MRLENDLIEDCRVFVVGQIAKLGAQYEYHCVEHTLSVLSTVDILAKSEGINDKDWDLLRVAALFHDIGFLRDSINHEAASVWMMGEFLKYRMKPSDLITIEHLILTTGPGVVPMNLLEKIIKDADLSYLGTENFESISNRLRNEWAHIRQLSFTDENWLKMNVRFLQETTYYTASAKELYGPGKDANLQKLMERLKA